MRLPWQVLTPRHLNDEARIPPADAGPYRNIIQMMEEFGQLVRFARPPKAEGPRGHPKAEKERYKRQLGKVGIPAQTVDNAEQIPGIDKIRKFKGGSPRTSKTLRSVANRIGIPTRRGTGEKTGLLQAA